MSVSRFDEPFDNFFAFFLGLRPRNGKNAKNYRIVPQSGERAPMGHRGSKIIEWFLKSGNGYRWDTDAVRLSNGSSKRGTGTDGSPRQ